VAGQPLFELGRGELVPVLDYSDASGLGRILRALFAKTTERGAGSDLTVVFTAHNAFLLKTMALAGRGIAWLPKSLVTEELGSGRLVAAGSAALHVPLEVRLYRQNAVMAPTAEALWGLVSKESARPMSPERVDPEAHMIKPASTR
jgi:DNA-binding transcriptional LysR family regulator